jgi:KUP system potassium uptake protein
VLTLQADNKGEGGIFALYALLRRTKIEWLMIPAVIGGSALLADGIITPPISVASALEGLKQFNPNITVVVPIVMVILVLLFIFQRFGTKSVGGSFGPIMFIWFTMIGILGATNLLKNPGVLKAISPYYAYNLLVNHPGGFWLLGAVFLCTTGAEALYSDLGHCGRKNIQVSWGFVKTTLILNYFGQGSWLLAQTGSLGERNPFYSIMPQWFLISGIIIATAATIVASQALISGSYTLINEAMRLNFWPKVRVVYPTNAMGQIYIPSVNWLLCGGCLVVVYHFQTSDNMQAAYGLAIILTMLMTTLLLSFYLHIKHFPNWIIAIFLLVYGTVECSFLIANLEKFTHGGWLTLLIASCLIFVMLVWFRARRIMNRYTDFVELKDYVQMLIGLGNDKEIPKYATHLVYLTSANNEEEIESRIIYSIFQKFPKRADIYWLVHVNVVEEPYRMEYKVKEIINQRLIRVDFNLGFRVEPRVNMLFRKVVEDLVNNKEVDITSRYLSLHREKVIGDFRFVVLERFLSYENELPFYEKITLDIYFLLKHRSLSDEKAFGLDTSSVTVEKVPYIISPVSEIPLKRIK